MNRQIFLTSPQAHLVLVEPDDAGTIAHWFNDARVTAHLARGSHPMTEVSEREYLTGLYKSTDQLIFGLWHKTDDKLVGVIGLHHIDHLNQTAELGITIGDSDHWSKGLGTEVITLLVAHAFGRLNLRNVRLRVFGGNVRAQRCYEKCGFKEVGRFPKHIIKDGVWHDEVHMVVQNPVYA